MTTELRVLVPLLVGLVGLLAGGGFFLAARGLVAEREAREADPDRVLLLTGFGPFGAVEENPSWEAASALEGARIGRTVVRTARLDVVYANAAAQLREAIRTTSPDRVLCLGVAPGDHLRVEVTARNRDASPAPDNAGEVRADAVIRLGGPDLLPSRLPVQAILARLAEEGYEVRTSEDAGGYLCNHVFYRVVDELPDDTIAGFVHVPTLEGPWDLARLQAAVRCIVEVMDEVR